MRGMMIRMLGLLSLGLLLLPAWPGEVRVPIGPGGVSVITVEVKSIKELREEGIVRQQQDFSCGAASVATIFTGYLDIPCTEKDIIDYIVAHNDVHELILRKGFTLLDLKQFAESRQVQATGYRLTFDQLCKQTAPVLLPLLVKDAAMRHFVVFLGTREDKVFLADPALGRYALPRAEFEPRWDTKIGMVFSRPNNYSIQQTVLAIRPIDEIALPTPSVFTVATAQTLFPNHFTNEF